MNNMPIGCGFFFDGQNGLIGSGNFSSTSTIPPYQLRIWRTTNGGNNWTQSSTPNGIGRVTSIFMKDANVGYASIYSSTYSLWKTTDGGTTWRDHSQGENGASTCIHVTSSHLVKTMWARNGGSAGGTSSNDGATFNNIFESQFSEESYNGIDFIDDRNGIVTPGPGQNNPDCLLTNDGGQTWSRGGQLDESWGIYAAKGHGMYITLAEGNYDFDQTSVKISTNGGISWSTRHVFPDNSVIREFTGHIHGKGTSVYVQSTNQGLFRSDNLGTTWKNVGGPNHSRDTRFFVTGCQGEVVFAFDNFGGIWRTTDGGDGTLSGGGSGAGPLSLSVDSILISTLYCQPELGFVTLSVPPCALFSVDSIYIVSQQNEFTTDSTKRFSVVDGSSVTVPVRFQYGSSATRTGVLHFKGTIGGRQIDTTIILIGKNATAPEPFIGLITSVFAGDTTHIPIHLTPTVDTFTIKRYRLHLSYNTDLLSCEDFDIIGTLSNPIISHQIINDANGVELICELRNPITEKSDLSQPLVKLVMQTYVTNTLESSIRLDTLSVATQTPLPLCFVPLRQYQAKYECGDSILVQLMRDAGTVQINYVQPNPSDGKNPILVGVLLPAPMSVLLEVMNMQGIVQMTSPTYELQSGSHELTLDISGLSSGSHVLQLRNGLYVFSTRLISIKR